MHWIPNVLALSATALLAATGVASACPSPERGEVIYVNAAAPPGGNGTSWALAYDDLQDALAGAVAGDEIWVAAGVYRPDAPGGARESSFVLFAGVGVYGGFAGDEQHLWERDWVANETILSGDLNGNDLPNFENYEDNSFHVLLAAYVDETAVLDGFTVTAGFAEEEYELYSNGAGLHALAASPTVRNCTFRLNMAGDINNRRVDGGFDDPEHRWGGGGIFYIDGAVSLENCVFDDNQVQYTGGAVRIINCDPITVEDCSFLNNGAAVSAGLSIADSESATVTGCTFAYNSVTAAAGGGLWVDFQTITVSDCTFRYNVGGLAGGGGLAVQGDDITYLNCSFIANSSEFVGGGLIEASATATLVNCAFSRNTAVSGGGVYSFGDRQYVNCTFASNDAFGVRIREGDVFMGNCVFWGNGDEQIYCSSGVQLEVTYCDVQGGWPGANNIDADPLFVQPGADDLRLSFGSPCVNAGSNALVPPGILFDILGNDRFIDGIVDMGAYEGEYEQGDWIAIEENLDTGDQAILIPQGGVFDPLQRAAVVFTNVSGPNNAVVSVIEFEGNVHPSAGGFGELGATLRLDTSLADGEFLAQIFLPFDPDMLGGLDPLTLDVTYFAEVVGNWALAVSANTQNSPGHAGPIGDRILRVAPEPWGLSNDLGDWGVYWDPAAERGCAWANVDFAGDFAFGAPLCGGDCHQPPDGVVNVIDLNAVLAAWGFGAGPFDVNNDGTVDLMDILDVLAAWGVCP